MTVQWRFIGQSENRKSLNNGESAGIRTQDPRLKRAMLYRLSYRLSNARRPRFSVGTRGGGIIPLTHDSSLRRVIAAETAHCLP